MAASSRSRRRPGRASWHLPGPPLVESAHVDYRGLLADAGFAVEIYEEPPGWRSQQQALPQGIVAAAQDVTHEIGAHYPAMARVFVTARPQLGMYPSPSRRLPSPGEGDQQ